MRNSRALMQYYLQRNAVQKGRFTLASGRTSDLYIDSRMVTTHPTALTLIVKDIIDIIIKNQIVLDWKTSLAGPIVSGAIIVTALSLELDTPFIMCRGNAKDHGLQKNIEGDVDSYDRFIIVDDILTSGTTIMKTINALRCREKEVTDVIVVIDREEGGKDELEIAYGVKVHALITKTELLGYMDNEPI